MKNNGVINGLRRGESTTPIESELRNKAIDNIFELNLAVAKNERILVFADDYKPEIFAEAKYVAERGTHYGRVDFFKYPNTGMNGTEPPISLWEIAFGKNIVKAIKAKGSQFVTSKLKNGRAGRRYPAVRSRRFLPSRLATEIGFKVDG
jgi:hypothetical protein